MTTATAPSLPPASAPATTSAPVTPSDSRSSTDTETARLAAFFAAAQQADARLRTASARVNAGIGRTTIVIDAPAVAAVKAVDVDAVARAIPAGLPPTLLQQVLEVYADLSSRQAAFRRVLDVADLSPLTRSSPEGKDLIRCLGNGAAPARWFAGDLAAVRTTAAGMPAVAPAAPTSRAAAELALRLHAITLPNTCADECGGYVPRPVPLHRIVWGAVRVGGQTWDGRFGDTGLFTARYVAGQGWRIGVNAC